MDKETILKCIKIADEKFKALYDEAKRVGDFDPVKEMQYVKAASAVGELKNELWELWQRCK